MQTKNILHSKLDSANTVDNKLDSNDQESKR